MAAVKPQPAIMEKDEEADTDVHPLQYAWNFYVFSYSVGKGWEDNMQKIAVYWEELLMLIIGNDWETEAESEQICGAVFQRRARGPKISLWTSDAEDEATVMRIGRRVKERLKFPDRLAFQTVQQQQNVPKGRDSVEGKYFV
ncbi:unnamed protein product [Dibothriocephalus latus]|uniref:Eukaryotic translation initiation factor 4E n=1 Tax=Dibothriocephalus latus TaxID=60516 RepID=A0A3P7LP84_DIBLA|nr:unnamed protein product [Dibothriocephalus latus]